MPQVHFVEGEILGRECETPTRMNVRNGHMIHVIGYSLAAAHFTAPPALCTDFVVKRQESKDHKQGSCLHCGGRDN